ncbi:MAG: hypothetical protein DI536_28735 [Archangium gephyra]|uniref:Thiol:disulfide interchange protein DsbD N-terminal domain-containing protein n=1 Tax=Archangium gephyra TaxID=48 RepID=A0A2W5T4G2_9BACT|nr:MAG: hypothetical protein DI536_28735 [Archangium gephyra]
MTRTILAATVLMLAACKKEEVAVAPTPPILPQARAEQPEPPPSAGTEFEVAIAAAPPYVVGKESIATVSIAAKSGFHVNPDYPVSFKPSSTEGVKYAGERVQLSNVTKKTPCKDKEEDNCAVEIALPLTPEAKGVAKIEGVLSFSVCSDEKCLTPKQTLVLAVEVTDAPAQ